MSSQTQKKLNEQRLKPLLDAALQGDSKAHSILLREVSLLAKHFILRKTGFHGDVDDIVQEILISVHKALHTYEPDRNCMPWLAAIMHYRLSDWLRCHYRASVIQKVPLEEIENFLEISVTEEITDYEYIHKAVGSLSEAQQSVIHAMYQEELSVAETSQKLGISVSTVKVTAHRAYKKLRERLEE